MPGYDTASLIATADDLEKRMDAMEEEMKKKPENAMEHDKDKDKNKDANKDDEEENKDADTDDDDDAKNADSEDMKKLKQENAMLIANVKKPIIARVLNASKMAGATPDQLKYQEKFLTASSLKAAQDFADGFAPLVSNQTPYNIQTPVPDITAVNVLNADKDDKDGIDLLKEAGVY